MTTLAADTRARLLAAVLADPDSDAVRLVFADWLDDQGEEERAEFIRVQIEIARMDEEGEGVIDENEGHTCVEQPCPVCALVEKYEALRRRERELTGDTDERGWFSEFNGYVLMTTPPVSWSDADTPFAVVRRGFVHAVTCTAADWLAHADALTGEHPIMDVRLTTWPGFSWSMDHLPLDWPQHLPMNEERSVALDALKHCWPGITFHLPA